MTGYTVHTGSNLKFTEGWDRVFKANTSSGAKAAKAAAKKAKPAKKAGRPGKRGG